MEMGLKEATDMLGCESTLESWLRAKLFEGFAASELPCSVEDAMGSLDYQEAFVFYPKGGALDGTAVLVGRWLRDKCREYLANGGLEDLHFNWNEANWR